MSLEVRYRHKSVASRNIALTQLPKTPLRRCQNAHLALCEAQRSQFLVYALARHMVHSGRKKRPNLPVITERHAHLGGVVSQWRLGARAGQGGIAPLDAAHSPVFSGQQRAPDRHHFYSLRSCATLPPPVLQQVDA